MGNWISPNRPQPKGNRSFRSIELIAKQLSIKVNQLCGWAGPELAKKENAVLASSLPKFAISGDDANNWKGKKRMLYDCTRKVLGSDTQNYPQQIGDCTSFGAKNAMEYLQCTRIVLEGENELFHSIYPPYFYGCSRVFIGNSQINGDGSLGVWTQAAAKQYGVLAASTPNCPLYSGQIAQSWGNNGPDQQFIPIAKKNLVQTTAKITESTDAAAAIYNGYPITVCSNQGFSYDVDSQGFHVAQGTWGHCMTLIGYEDHPTFGLYFIILNSWGDMFGHLTDFTTNEQLPIGVLRVHGDVVDNMLKADGGDSFAYSSFEGFPGNGTAIDKALFDVIGV